MAEIPGSNLEELALSQAELISLLNQHLWSLWCLHNGAEDYTATPPGGPSNGNVYIIGASATGIWVGKDYQVAIYIAGGWHYLDAPVEGWRLWVKDVDMYYRYTGAVWLAERSMGTFDLDNGGGTTTTVSDTATQTASRIFLFPTSANAAAAVGNAAGVYVSTKTAATSFVVTHPASPGAAASMDYVILN